MIELSVIVPVYNGEKYLKKCLNSLINQRMKSFEIIIINDGSTDLSDEIINKYKEKYPKLIKCYKQKNKGQGAARNVGLRAAKGRYIGFVDSDDFAEHDMFIKLYNKAIKTSSDYVECNYRYLKLHKGRNIELKQYCKTRKYKSAEDMFINPLVSPWNKLYKAELIKNNKIKFPEGVIYEDTSFFVKLIPFINKREYVCEKLINHVNWPDSTMNSSHALEVFDIFYVLQDLLKFYKNNDLYCKYQQELEFFCIKILLFSSLGRILSVQDKNIRNQLLDKTDFFINRIFPSYKANKYFRSKLYGLYIRSMSRRLMPIYGNLYRAVKYI